MESEPGPRMSDLYHAVLSRRPEDRAWELIDEGGTLTLDLQPDD